MAGDGDVLLLEQVRMRLEKLGKVGGRAGQSAAAQGPASGGSDARLSALERDSHGKRSAGAHDRKRTWNSRGSPTDDTAHVPRRERTTSKSIAAPASVDAGCLSSLHELVRRAIGLAKKMRADLQAERTLLYTRSYLPQALAQTSASSGAAQPAVSSAKLSRPSAHHSVKGSNPSVISSTAHVTTSPSPSSAAATSASTLCLELEHRCTVVHLLNESASRRAKYSAHPIVQDQKCVSSSSAADGRDGCSRGTGLVECDDLGEPQRGEKKVAEHEMAQPRRLSGRHKGDRVACGHASTLSSRTQKLKELRQQVDTLLAEHRAFMRNNGTADAEGTGAGNGQQDEVGSAIEDLDLNLSQSAVDDWIDQAYEVVGSPDGSEWEEVAMLDDAPCAPCESLEVGRQDDGGLPLCYLGRTRGGQPWRCSTDGEAGFAQSRQQERQQVRFVRRDNDCDRSRRSPRKHQPEGKTSVATEEYAQALTRAIDVLQGFIEASRRESHRQQQRATALAGLSEVGQLAVCDAPSAADQRRQNETEAEKMRQQQQGQQLELQGVDPAEEESDCGRDASVEDAVATLRDLRVRAATCLNKLMYGVSSIARIVVEVEWAPDLILPTADARRDVANASYVESVLKDVDYWTLIIHTRLGGNPSSDPVSDNQQCDAGTRRSRLACAGRDAKYLLREGLERGRPRCLGDDLGV